MVKQQVGLVMACHLCLCVQRGWSVKDWFWIEREPFKSGNTDGHGTIASSCTQGYNSHEMIIQPYDSRVEELHTTAAFLSRSTTAVPTHTNDSRI